MKVQLPRGLEIGDACVCLNLRRAARQVARRYDEVLRPANLTSGQFSILAALLREVPVSLTELAEMLAMDRTTLNRNLKPLERDGLVRTARNEFDQRVRAIELSECGRQRMSQALPLWRQAQALSEEYLGIHGWAELKSRLTQIR